MFNGIQQLTLLAGVGAEYTRRRFYGNRKMTLCLVAVIDWYSSKVRAWRLSNTRTSI